MPLPKNQRKYVLDNEVAMRKWDKEKNKLEGLDPAKLTVGSHIFANFICPNCGNTWKGAIRDAIRYNGCKICMKKARSSSNVMAKLKNRQVLFESNPELEKEWDYKENDKIGLNPKNVMAGTNKEANWICSKGHKYKAYISNRTIKHTGCTFCSGQAVLQGFNDLATTRPDLLDEWDYEENKKLGITPQNVMKGSRVIVNWICPFGHHYKKEVKVRCCGQGCTICSKESQTSFPEQAIYFYISKVFKDTENRYGKPEIDIFIPSLNFGIEYDGAYTHKNKDDAENKKNQILKEKGIKLIRIKEVTKLKEDTRDVIYCKTNSNNTYLNNVLSKIEKIINNTYNINIKFNPDITKDRIKIEEQYISLRKKDSIANKYPEIAKEWDYERNGEIKPEYITCGSHRKYFWICENGHSYECSTRDRINGRGCNICRDYRFIKGVNDFQTKYPKLAKYWDNDLNKLKPSDIKYTNDQMFWWRCSKGHSYQTQIKLIIKYNGCLGCSKAKHHLIKGVNDLKTVNPSLALEWNYEKNKDMPEDYVATSNKEVWWKCAKCGYEWLKIIHNRPQCPKCRNETSIINVYSRDNGNLIASYNGIVDLCEKMELDYNSLKGCISSVCNRKQKTLRKMYILRYEIDDEFKNLSTEDRIRLIKKYLQHK